MNRRLPFTLLALLAGAVLVSSVVVLAAVQQEIGWDVIASGGGLSSGGNVQINDTLGQPIVGPAQGDGVSLGAGYSYGAAAPSPTATPTGTPPTPTYTPTSTPTHTPTATPTGTVTPPAHLIYLPVVVRNYP